jgi:hypothetical protein
MKVRFDNCRFYCISLKIDPSARLNILCTCIEYFIFIAISRGDRAVPNVDYEKVELEKKTTCRHKESAFNARGHGGADTPFKTPGGRIPKTTCERSGALGTRAAINVRDGP